jgi:DNA polymerase-4
VLHVDLDPFFVSVERSLDPSLRGRALVIGGDGSGMGFVAAVSEEARRAGVHAGMTLLQARHVAPDAVFRRGDLDTYGRVGEEVTAVLLAASRRVERPSADEAFVDLGADPHPTVPPVRAAETIRDELQRRLGLDASLGLASSRLAARVASGWAKPRGLLVVLPGYERSFVATKPVSLLGLPAHLESALEHAGFATLGQVAEAEAEALAGAVGQGPAERVRALARGEGEPEIELAAPPAFLHEEASVRDRRSDALALVELAESLARRAARRLRPFRFGAASIAVEVRRASESSRRATALAAPTADEDGIAAAARELALPLVEPADAVRWLSVRLARLGPESTQSPLFPATPAFRRAL